MFFYDSDIVFEKKREVLDVDIINNNYKITILPENTDELIKSIATHDIPNQPNLLVSLEQMLKERNMLIDQVPLNNTIDEPTEEYKTSTQISISCGVLYNEWYDVIKYVDVRTYVALMKVCKSLRGICTSCGMIDYIKTQWTKKDLCILYNNCLLSNDTNLYEIYYNKDFYDWNTLVTIAHNDFVTRFFPDNRNLENTVVKEFPHAKMEEYEHLFEEYLIKSNVLLKIIMDDDIKKLKRILENDVVSAYIPIRIIQQHENIIGIKNVNLIYNYVEKYDDIKPMSSEIVDNPLCELYGSLSDYDGYFHTSYSAKIHIVVLCRLWKKLKILSCIDKLFNFAKITFKKENELIDNALILYKLIVETHKIKI